MQGDRSEVLRYRVQGSEAQPYQVSFQRIGESVRTRCTCKAGLSGMFCKHRDALIRGNAEAVVSGDVDKLAIIGELLAGTDARAALDALAAAEDELEQAKQRVKACKLAVTRLLGS